MNDIIIIPQKNYSEVTEVLINSWSGWWLNQPFWKICSSNWKKNPQSSGWKIQKYLSCHHRSWCIFSDFLLPQQTYPSQLFSKRHLRQGFRGGHDVAIVTGPFLIFNGGGRWKPLGGMDNFCFSIFCGSWWIYIYIHISSGAEKKMHGFLLEKKHWKRSEYWVKKNHRESYTDKTNPGNLHEVPMDLIEY